jgi:hypothetical protein
MTNLVDIQATLRDINPHYVDMLDWREYKDIFRCGRCNYPFYGPRSCPNCGESTNLSKQPKTSTLLKAIPKKPLSDLAHKSILKVFRRLGGKFVSYDGQNWFELILLEETQAPNRPDLSTRRGESDILPCEPYGSALKQMDAQVASLCRAGRKCLEEE